MIIIKDLIINYIKNISIEDINNFAIKNDIYLTSNELSFVYEYIKNNYLLLLNNPSDFNLLKYKDKFSNDNYIKINNLIDKYKKKYNIN